MSPGQTGFVPGTKWVCPRDKPRFSSYFTQRKPSLSLEQTQFVPGTFWGRRAAERVYVLKVYVPFSFPRGGKQGRFVIFCVSFFFQCFEVPGYPDAGEKAARKMSLSHPFLCASNPSKN